MTEREKMLYVVENNGRCHYLSCDGCPINYLQGCENDNASLRLANQWLADHPETPAKPAPDPRRYEIAMAALEKLATYKGSWDGDRYSINEGSVNGIAREALTLIADLDKEAEK